MAKIYMKRVQSGLMTLQEVPAKWREQVRRLLAE